MRNINNKRYNDLYDSLIVEFIDTIKRYKPSRDGLWEIQPPKNMNPLVIAHICGDSWHGEDWTIVRCIIYDINHPTYVLIDTGERKISFCLEDRDIHIESLYTVIESLKDMIE